MVYYPLPIAYCLLPTAICLSPLTYCPLPIVHYLWFHFSTTAPIMQKKLNAAITAVGGFVPDDKLTNADLEKMVDTNDEWIRTRTGIQERRILKGKGLATSDMGAPAVKDLCQRRGIDPMEIDCIICATVT